MKRKLGETFLSALVGACVLAVFTALGLLIVLRFRSLYIFNINLFNLEEVSGLSKTEILRNYDWLVSWCIPWNAGEFAMPSIPVSEDGLYHFEQVKEIMGMIFKAGLAAAIALLGIFAGRKRDFSRIAASGGAIAMAAAAILAVFMYLAPHKTFVLFHEIVFRNDKWIFDPATDPVINILPESYFMQCAAIIAIVVFAGSIALILPFSLKVAGGRERELADGKDSLC